MITTLYAMVGGVRVFAGLINTDTGEITLDVFPRDGRLSYEVEVNATERPVLVWRDQLLDLHRNPEEEGFVGTMSKIALIKAVREVTGLGLGEAKERVEDGTIALRSREPNGLKVVWAWDISWCSDPARLLALFCARHTGAVIEYMT